MIGIIGAMSVEVAGLKNEMQQMKIKTVAEIDFCQGTICGTECVVAQCSPGKVNAAVCAQIMILLYSPTFIINSGVAGGIGKNVHMGDLVISTQVVQHDMDTSLLGDEKGLIPGINLIKIAASKKFAALVYTEAQKIYDGAVHQGVVATGDQFIASSELLRSISDKFDAIACEMEGGSVGQVCYLNKVEFLVLRAISDNGNDDAAMDYSQFVEIAAKKSTSLLCKILPQLTL